MCSNAKRFVAGLNGEIVDREKERRGYLLKFQDPATGRIHAMFQRRKAALEIYRVMYTARRWVLLSDIRPATVYKGSYGRMYEAIEALHSEEEESYLRPLSEIH